MGQTNMLAPEERNLERIEGISQLYTRHDENGRFALIMARVMDDFLIGRTPGSIRSFIAKLQVRFQICGTLIDQPL